MEDNRNPMTIQAKQPTQTPLHGLLRPLLEDVLQKGIAAGYPREEVLAVMIDLVDDTNFEDVETR